MPVRIDRFGNIVPVESKPAARGGFNDMRKMRTSNDAEGRWGSGGSTATGFTRGNNVNGSNHNNLQRDGSSNRERTTSNRNGFLNAIEKRLGIEGRSVQLPGGAPPIPFVWVGIVGLAIVVLGWKTGIAIALLYFISLSSQRNRHGEGANRSRH